MQRLVNDLLVLAKAEQPDLLDLEAVDVELLTNELHAKAVALASRAWRLEEVGRGRIVADRHRLTQAMMQLAQNAVDHTAEGAEIALGSAVANEQARFWVRDTGKGIDPMDQERIFGRFARGSQHPRRSSEGAGLGLAIVRVIAEAHHGTVEIRSRPTGATFTVVIPMDQPVTGEER